MKLSERLEKDNREIAEKRRLRARQEEDGETLAYRTRPKPVFLNDTGHTFDRIGDDSFHVAPSVFDRQAVFHTGEKK